MPTLELNGGLVLLFDEEDAAVVAKHNWYAMKQNHSHTYYVVANIKDPNAKSGKNTVRLHRLIMGVTDSKVFVDHKNQDGLDNRRQNLRMATKTQNHYNSKRRTDNRSGFKGVRIVPWSRRWQARIGGRHLGVFDTPELAAIAYDKAALSLYGEFARTNFPVTERMR